MIKLQVGYVLLALISIFLNLTLGLYEDQVGKFDWKLSYIGKAKHAQIDAKRVIVATEENVLAALHLKTGHILWRQILEKPKEQQIKLLHVDKDIVTVSGSKNSWYIRGWDIATGTILWEWILHSERSTEAEWVVYNGQLIHVQPIVGSHLEVTTYQLQTGQNRGVTSQITAPWIPDLKKCALAHTYFVCVTSEGRLQYLKLVEDSNKVFTRPLHALIGDAPGLVQIEPFVHPKPAFLLIRNNVARLVTIENESLDVLPQSVLPNSRAVTTGEGTSLLQLEINPNNPEKLLRIVNSDLNEIDKKNIVEVRYPLGLGAPYFVAATCKASTCDLLLGSSDNALTLVRSSEGKILWTREEALSHIVASEFLELPVSDLDASIEHEFDANADMMSMFYRRILTQTKQLISLLSGTQLLASKTGLVRDEFGLHKLIIVATSVGKLFAIDTFTGSIVWSYRLPNVVPFLGLNGEQNMLLFVQRTARYAPLSAQCMLVAKDANTGKGVLFRFDPISGLSETGIERLTYSVKQTMLLPYEDENHVKGVLILSNDNQIYIYPSNFKRIVYQHARTTYLYSIDPSTSQLQGYNLMYSTEEVLRLNPTWNVNLAPSQLLALSTRPYAERVHSQGRVLPDRSVYYKYINPNIIALITITDDAVHKHVLSLHLVDGITGLVLYSASHKRAKGPVHLIHSENWVVYSYFNEKFRRVELATVELYEGRSQSNSTIFSSYAVSQLPHVETQAYILPGVPQVSATTLTERGITSKFVLIALSNGMVAEVPWAFIQPRLADVACGPEESCIPYMPEIPLHPEASLNYNQTLERVRGIQVAPARLESTCHVLVHGLDLFYTRVSPSKQFDVLKDDFDHGLIVLMLSGLVLASYVTKKLASRKALKFAWK